jgi:ABC-type glycerol-3-phosphate transport system substrate-binding protein
MKRIYLAAAIVGVALLSACASPAPEPTATTEPAAMSVDRTADVKAELAEATAALVTRATETEPGRIEVETTIVDPRGDDSSPEAQIAMQVCEMTAKLPDVKYVNVKEADGTSFILFGHPLGPEGECGEV